MILILISFQWLYVCNKHFDVLFLPILPYSSDHEVRGAYDRTHAKK